MINFIKKLKNGQTFFRKSPVTNSFSETERAERIFYLNYLCEGMTVFDVGANVGELTLLFSRFVGDGNVHAFEASKTTFDNLENICTTAGRRNITTNHQAVADKNGFIELYIYEDSLSAFNSQAQRPLKDYGLDIEPIGTEKVSAVTIDEYCRRNNIKQIDLLKIDVEGAELQVMRGASEMLEGKRIKCLSFEFGQTTFDMGNTPEQIESFLNKIGYKIKNIIEGAETFPGRESVEAAQYAMHIATPG